MPSINKLKVGNTLYDLYGTGGDVLPVGTQALISAEASIPTGWENIEDNFEEYEIEDLDISTSVTTHNYSLYRSGKLVTLQLDAIFVDSVVKDTWQIIGKVPAELNNVKGAETTGTISNGSTGALLGYCKFVVDASNNIKFKSNVDNSTLTAIAGSLTWLLADTMKLIKKVNNVIGVPVELVEDTGWIDLAIDDTIVEWRAVEEGGTKPADYYKPQIRRIGKQVYMKGQIKWTTDNVNTVFVTIPAEFRPSYEIRFVQGMWLGISGEIKTVGYDQMYSPPASADKTTLTWVSIASNWVVD